MTDAELWALWRLWLGVGVAVVLVAAALLVTIWLTARSLLRHARRALRAAETIRDHTGPIWELQRSREAADALLDTVRRLETKGARLAEALTSQAAAGGPR